MDPIPAQGHPALPTYPPQRQPPHVAALEPCRGALILAKVGPEVILSSEVIASISALVARDKDLSTAQKETQVKALTDEVTKGINQLTTRLNNPHPLTQSELERQSLIRRLLQNLIDTKLIYHDARRTIPEENFPHVEESLKKQFQKVQLNKIMEEAEVETWKELDQRLRARGTSLERQKQAFIEQTLAQQWIRQQVKLEEEITYDQMMEYYRHHLADFEKPARARWEELMARFSKYSHKEEAGAAIARMGNQVASGAPLAQVAKTQSDGIKASDGGQRDWTTKGSLVCEVLDRVLFELPVGQLSPILESEDAFYIIRVIEREEAHCIPFLEAQVEIEPKIRQQRTKEQLRSYVARLKKQIPVWTILDEQAPGEQAAGEQLSGRPAYPHR
jgi:parvulin-like peptidyl-prolyl isomerase